MFSASILIAIFIFGCAADDVPPPANTTVVDGDEPPVVIVPPPDETDPTTDTDTTEETTDTTTDTTEPLPELSPVAFAVKIDAGFYLSDGLTMFLFSELQVSKAGPRLFSSGADLIVLDAYGLQVSKTPLPEIPTKIHNNGDTYFCREYPPELAYSLGALYQTYSEIWKNGEVVSQWYLNEYECRAIVQAYDSVFVIDQNGTYQTVEGPGANVSHVEPLEFYVHDLDTINQRLYFNQYLESYSLNYALNIKQWIKYDQLFYSENGYTWEPVTGLLGAVTALDAFNYTPYPVDLPNGEAPVLLEIGVLGDRLFWLECNSGYLFEYDPQADTLTQSWRIYTGDDTHATGTAMRDSLKPLLVGEKLYFSNDGNIYSLGMTTGEINIFYAGNGEVVRYD